MRLSSRLFGSRYLFASALVLQFAGLAVWSDAAVASKSKAQVVLAQSDTNDVPPELKSRVRPTNQPDGQGGDFGGRPFRRPGADQDDNAAPGPSDTRSPGGRPDGLRGGGPGEGRGARIREYVRGSRGNRDRGSIFKAMLDLSSLGLNDDQKQKIQQIRGRNAMTARDMGKALRLNRDQMKDMMFDPKSTEEQIRSKLKQVRQMQEKMEEMQVGDFLAIRKVLTPDQRVKFADLKPSSEGKIAGKRFSGARDDDGGPPPFAFRNRRDDDGGPQPFLRNRREGDDPNNFRRRFNNDSAINPKPRSQPD